MKKISTPETKKEYLVYRDFNGRTCLEVDRINGIVVFISLNVDDGLQIHRKAEEVFDDEFNILMGYDIPQACRTYLEYGKYVLKTSEAATSLLRKILINEPITVKEKKQMAHSQEEIRKDNERMARAAGMHPTPTPGGKDKPVDKKKTATDKKPADKKPTDKKPADKKPTALKEAKPKVKKENASQLFRDLIMEGKLTDDQIFAKAVQKYGLDAKKRWYVSWYRYDLRKKGLNPPDAVEPKK
jgi:hypothetical protein